MKKPNCSLLATIAFAETAQVHAPPSRTHYVVHNVVVPSSFYDHLTHTNLLCINGPLFDKGGLLYSL